MTSYPFCRNIIWFSLTPLLCGFASALIIIFVCKNTGSYETTFGSILNFLGLLLLFSLAALFLLVIPVFAVGLIVSLAKLKGWWLTYFLVAWGNGIAVFFWSYQIIGFEKFYFPQYTPAVHSCSLDYIPVRALVLCGFFSWIMALLLLPRNKSIH